MNKPSTILKGLFYYTCIHNYYEFVIHFTRYLQYNLLLLNKPSQYLAIFYKFHIITRCIK